MRIKFLLSFVVGFLLSMVAYGQTTTTWKGGGSADISIPTNWTNGLPTGTVTGTINACVGCLNPIPTLSVNVTFNSIKIDKGTIKLNDFELTTTTLSITGGIVKSSGAGRLTTGNLSEMKESIFNGEIKITALKGNSSGGNTFDNKLNIELAVNATGNLLLNRTNASKYNDNCSFVNNSNTVKILSVASYTTDEPTIFVKSCEFINNDKGAFIVSSKPKINFIETNSFSNNGSGTFNAFVNARADFKVDTEIINTNGIFTLANNTVVQFLANTSCINTNGTFALATGNSNVSGVTLSVENGKTTNLLSSNAIGTFNSVNLTNTASNSTITTASATTNNKLNINNGLSVVFATGVNSTINLNKVICEVSVLAVTIDVLSSANLTINASIFKDLSITNKSNLNINSSTFKDLSITDNSNASNVVTISTITCLGNLLLAGTGSAATNIVGVNTFNKNITIDKEVNISGANINNINLVADNQFINSNNNTVISIPGLNLTGKTTINTLVNITDRLTIGGIVDCLSGTLSNPKLHIANGATITVVGTNAFIMGAVKKIGIRNSFVFPVGTIRIGQTPENKYVPLTLRTISVRPFPQTDFITVAYVSSGSNNPNPDIIDTNCEYWGFNTSFDGQCRFSIANTLNFCTTESNGDGLSTFYWAGNSNNWKNIANTFNITTKVISSTNTATGLINFNTGKDNEIALGYENLLYLDLSEVATKTFTFTTSTNITRISGGARSGGCATCVGVSPKFAGTTTNGTLTLKFTDAISSEIIIKLIKSDLLNTTQIANTNNDVNIKINGQTTTLNNLYKITNTSPTSPRAATIKFYKLPQTAPSTALGITSNLTNGIKLVSDLTFTFSNPSKFELKVFDAGGTLISGTPLPMTISASSLSWTPTGLLAGTYKFTLTDLTTSTIVYQGQFIK